MTESNNINYFIEILKDNMVKLVKYFEDNEISIKDKDENYIIDYNLFKELMKNYCFNNNKKEIQYIPTSIIPPKKESTLIPVVKIPVPEEQLKLFKNIILGIFEKKRNLTLSYVYGSRSTFFNLEELYYRFFYSLCNETYWLDDKIKEVLDNISTQWRLALEGKEIEIKIYLPVDSIYILGNEILVNKDNYSMKNHTFITVKKLENSLVDSRFYNVLIIGKIKLKTKIFFSNFLGDPTFEKDFELYDKQYKEALKDLHLFVNALYLEDFHFKWRSPVLHLPWWFEPNMTDFSRLERKYHNISKNLENTNFDNILSKYSALKNTKLLEKDPVILTYYFRLNQKRLIDSYFFIDVVTFLETMFTKGSKDYVNLRLRLNAASLLAKDEKEFWKLHKFLGKIYEIRSIIVHGSDWFKKFEKFMKSWYCESERNISKLVGKFHNEILLYFNFMLTYLIKKLNEDPEILRKMNDDPLYFFKNCRLYKSEEIRNKIIEKIRNKYIREKYNYENKWEEICELFNI